MLSVPISGAFATKPEPVTGTFGITLAQLGTLEIIEIIPKSGNSPVSVETLAVDQTFYGDISGVCHYFGRWVEHYEDETGAKGFTTHGIYTFEEVSITVGDVTKIGSLVIKSTSNLQHTVGIWRVIEASGDLEGLHGQGTFGQGAIPMTYTYEGQMSFN